MQRVRARGWGRLLAACVCVLGTRLASGQVRHDGSLAPSVRHGLARPAARLTFALSAGRGSSGAGRRLGGDVDGGSPAERDPERFGEPLPINVTLQNAGAWEAVPHDDGHVWRATLACPGARSLHVYAERFRLLPGDRLYVHNGRGAGSRGAYTAHNNAPHGTFATSPLPGDELHLEFVPGPARAPQRPSAHGARGAPHPPSAPEGEVDSQQLARLLELTLLVAGTTPLFGEEKWAAAKGHALLPREAPLAHAAVGAGGAVAHPDPAGGSSYSAAGGGAPGLEAGAVTAEGGAGATAGPEEKSSPTVRISSWISSSGDCMVNLACQQGHRWEPQAAGVAAIIEHHTASVCTGTLINSLDNAKPRQYLLTAFHCVRSRVEASDFDPDDNFLPWSFLFNWQSTECDDNTPPAAGVRHVGAIDSVYGATVRAYGNDTDFALIEIHESIPESFHVHYNGWDARGITPNMSLIIHHPTSDLKKITIDYNAPQTKPFGGIGYYQVIFGRRRVWRSPHWYVERYEVGSTEGGSSGGPLFDWYGRLIGVLHGGYADCGNPRADWYGKLFHFFDDDGKWGQSGPHRSIGAYLDPYGTGVRMTDGTWDTPHAVANRLDAGVQLSARVLTFGPTGGRHADHALSVSLLAPPRADVVVSVQVHGDPDRCFHVHPARAEFTPADWESVRWLTVSWDSEACAAVSCALRLLVSSDDSAFDSSEPLEVALRVAHLPDGGSGDDDNAHGYESVGCFAGLPADHKRVRQPAISARACHGPCVEAGYDYFLLGGGSCYCLTAAAVDRELPNDDLPTSACRSLSLEPPHFHLYRTRLLGTVLAASAQVAARDARSAPSRGGGKRAAVGAWMLAVAGVLAVLAAVGYYRGRIAQRRQRKVAVAPAGTRSTPLQPPAMML